MLWQNFLIKIFCHAIFCGKKNIFKKIATLFVAKYFFSEFLPQEKLQLI